MTGREMQEMGSSDCRVGFAVTAPQRISKLHPNDRVDHSGTSAITPPSMAGPVASLDGRSTVEAVQAPGGPLILDARGAVALAAITPLRKPNHEAPGEMPPTAHHVKGGTQ